MTHFQNSGPHNPCPVCGRTKDSDCRIKEAGALVLCHSYTTGSTQGIENGYKFLKTSDKAAGYGVWAFDIASGQKPPKGPRKPGKQQFVYTGRDGKPVARVTRIDRSSPDGATKEFYQEHWNGKKWVRGLPEQVRPSLPIYRYAEVRAAITRGEAIFWVEGEGVADALWAIGIAATTTIGGSKGYRTYGTYAEDLTVDGISATPVLCPDRDQHGKAYMEEVAKDFPGASWCYVYPDSVVYPIPWQRIPVGGGCDVKDWIEDGATKEDILSAVRSPVTPEESAAALEAAEVEPCRRLKNIRLLESHWGNRIRLNELTGEIELDGEHLDIEEIPLLVAEEFNRVLSKDESAMIVGRIARRNAYHPIVEYLEHVEQRFPNEDGSSVTNIASRYLGTSLPIYDAFMCLTLVGAVRRAFEPGCKFDYTLILQGNQGLGKSSFWRILAGPNWFDDSMGSYSDKDERLKLHRAWITEWAELETIFGRKDQAAVKSFITSQIDYLRPPYGREVRPMSRRGIIVGTTNRDDFLTDPTGARRFWVVPVTQAIPFAQLQQERDRIWAAAVKLYRTGLYQDLSAEQKLQAQELVKNYEPEDPWWGLLENYAQQWESVSIPGFMSEVLRIELGRQTRQDHGRIADMLRRMNYSSKREWVGGKCKRLWVRSTAATTCHYQQEVVDQGQTQAAQSLQATPATRSTENGTKIPVFDRNSNGHPPPNENTFFSSSFSGSSGSEVAEVVETYSFGVDPLPDPLPPPPVDQVDQGGGGGPPLPEDEVELIAQLLREATQPAHLQAFAGLTDAQKQQVWGRINAPDQSRIRQLANGNGGLSHG